MIPASSRIFLAIAPAITLPAVSRPDERPPPLWSRSPYFFQNVRSAWSRPENITQIIVPRRVLVFVIYQHAYRGSGCLSFKNTRKNTHCVLLVACRRYLALPRTPPCRAASEYPPHQQGSRALSRREQPRRPFHDFLQRLSL